MPLARFRKVFHVTVGFFIAGSMMAAPGAEMRGTWSALSSSGQRLAGGWTGESHAASGGVTGTWTLFDTGGKILLRGSWSASKSPREWNGAWRASITGRDGGYSGTWTAETGLKPEARLLDMLESALRAVVSGTWKTGAHSGSWSIRAFP